MKSIVSVRGQTVIPREVREALGIKEGTTLIWSLASHSVRVMALPDDPIEASFGALKDTNVSTAALLADRRADRDKEESQAEEELKRWRRTPSTPRR